MKSMATIGGEDNNNNNNNNKDPFRSVKVYSPSDLMRYYEDVQKIILELGCSERDNETNRNAIRDNQSAISSLSLEEQQQQQPSLPLIKAHSSNNNFETTGVPATKPGFSLQHLEPRHRKSMMRCVLGHYFDSDTTTTTTTTTTTRSTIVSKAEFKQRLRLVERKQKWKMTRRLLFGQEENATVDGDDDDDNSNNREGNLRSDVPPQGHYWWESGILSDEDATGLKSGIRDQYCINWDNSRPPATVEESTQKNSSYDESKDDPKKFLSRLARGRTYKGKFRNLLEAYVTDTAANSERSNDKWRILLYDQIVGGRSETTPQKRSFEISDRLEVELLRLFIDELEEEASEASTSKICNDDKDGDDDTNDPESTKHPSKLFVGAEQISLLRSICDLDIFSSPKPHSSVLDDGGRSVGKRGEKDLETFLLERERSASSLSQEAVSNRILSPVWVRPKHKNRRSTKQKCKYVLEIPGTTNTKRSGTSSSTDSTNSNSHESISQGTTSEFDAMVVRIIGEGDTTTDNERWRFLPPIMIIQELWDAKATLDPSALLDVLEKKASSLQKILQDEKSNVLNLSDPSCVVSEDGGSSLMHGPESDSKRKIAVDGANFVILPCLETEKKGSSRNGNAGATSTSPVPMVYRVGIEPTRNSKRNNADDNHNSDTDNDRYSHRQYLPQIGIFASKMIGPGAAARRIQTIVYEGLLETDLITVEGVVQRYRNDCNRNGNTNVKSSDDDPRRCNRLVRERSIEIVERISGLIEALQPIAVVGTLPPNH